MRGESITTLDYLPVMAIRDYLVVLDCVLATEQISSLTVIGQSYGGLLAQAYLCHYPQCVERLILSSSGPANYSRAYIPVEYLCIGLARVLPENILKKMLLGGLFKLITLPAAEQAD